ncbi:MAG TPA: HAMP domain-containing sensor histidine kinase [Steroidobacteraceae bacterium]|nr:HAMP domain-containing sensor histidine kinase [Steroidobacteraceae bacterium]
MDSKGALSIRPARQSRRVVTLAGIWLAVILALGFWWASIVLRQSARIAELSQMAGMPAEAVAAEEARTHRMVSWEGGTFLLLLLTVSAALFWYYRRDLRRARGTQAFFAALTHELRTPLTSVRLQTEAIAAGEPSQELIERLLVDTHRLESQIDKTLELARIEGGGTLAEQAIRLDQWLERALRHIVATEGEGAQLTLTVEAGLPPVHGDTAALQLILRNLVENSVRHGERDVIHIRVEAVRAPHGVELRYRDDGRGYGGEPALLGRMFARGVESRGTGVGLYLVRVLMERMGGNVAFANAAEGGFAVTLHFKAEA